MMATISKRMRIASGKIYWREILACLLLLIGIYFLRQQKHEISSIASYFHQAKSFYLLVAGAFTLLFVVLQSAMYRHSFAAIDIRFKWRYAIELFLKRNLIAVFLPGGGVSALAYIPAGIRKAVGSRPSIHRASGLFAFAGILSTFLVCLPVLFTSAGMGHWKQTLGGLVLILALLLLVLSLRNSLRSKSWFYILVNKRFPKLAAQFHELAGPGMKKPFVYATIADSVGVELCGIIHLYLAMLATGSPASLSIAALAYIISLLLMVASPFLKGMGAVELSIVLVLTQYGYSSPQALAIAIIYRAFEFWLPLVLGLFAFLLKGKELFLRLAPALAIFFLGLVNIISVITPPLKERLHLMQSFLPAATIRCTNAAVLFIGMMLMITAAFLVKGLKNAWWIAVSISLLSIIGHLVKAFDYEEALIAAMVFLCLLFTRKHYRLRANPRLVGTGLRVAILAFAAVLAYGFVGFYFLEKRHFGIDFSWQQSLLNSARGFLMLEPFHIQSKTHFGKEFLWSFQLLGGLSWIFLFYTLIRPWLQAPGPQPAFIEKARELLRNYGASALDHFKISPDKYIFLSSKKEGFVSYAISGPFAIALEEPVCRLEDKETLLGEFDAHCKKFGLKTAYYRVAESSLGQFNSFGMKRLHIGQEALLDVSSFDLKGRSRKSLRNACNSLQSKGYQTRLCAAPHAAAFITELKSVSDEWLHQTERKEMGFAQGIFDSALIKNQDVIGCFDPAGKLVAFLNIIPDYVPGECTYDLIRKRESAPGGVMDALIIELVQYARGKGFTQINLGMVPAAGSERPDNTAEHLLKFAGHRLRSLKQFYGLRSFKEKYATAWINRYLVYGHDFDLVQLPLALKKVMRNKPVLLPA